MYLVHANDDNILYGTINVLTDKTNNTYKPFYPRTRKDLVSGIENVDNTADANKSVSYAVNAGKVNNLTIETAVPANAKFTDTTYSVATTSANGLMSATDKKKADVVVDNAAAHNGIYRGKDLTAYMDSGGMSAAIANGTFTDIYIGDYIIKTINLPAINYTDRAGNAQSQDAKMFTNVKWLVGAIDPHFYRGDIATIKHHVLLIPAHGFQSTVPINPTNDTTGGYLDTDMWRIHMPNFATAIKNTFGEAHVLKHRELLTDAVNATAPSGAGSGLIGAAAGYVWTDVEVNIPNEHMIYGSRVFGSGFDGGDFTCQLPLYALKCEHPNYISNVARSWFFLRTVASSNSFSIMAFQGLAAISGTSLSVGANTILPYFLYY